MAPAPGRRTARPLLRPGELLAGRYRLEHPVEPAPRAAAHEESPAVLWRATDEVLARPVAVKVLRAGGQRGTAAASPFLAAAAAAGGLSGPVLARVYDAAVEPGGRPAGDADVAYVISEWVDGQDLAAALREDGPFDPDSACALVAEVAEALDAAHARGVAHGRVHPGNVLVLPDGRLKLTDTATSAALPGRAVPAERTGDPTGPAADVRDLTAVLYAMLTGRWPASATPQPSCGVPAAPTVPDGRSRGRLTSPRQVRAGVPRALDDLVVRVLRAAPGDARPTTGAGLADALDDAVRTDAHRPVVARSPHLPGALRRRLPLLGAAVALLALGAGAYAVGREVGEVPPLDAGLQALVSPSPDTSAPADDQVDLTAAQVTDFDPPPGDGAERSGTVPNAVDDDPSTAWETERYRTAAFGGLKTGVGLLVDLGEPTALSRVELAVDSGTTVELRAGDAQGAAASDYRVVARGTAAQDGLVLTPEAGTTARQYLVWITGLPEGEGGSRARIFEMRFLRG